MLDDLLGALKHRGMKRHGYNHHGREHAHDRPHGSRHGSGYYAPMMLAALRAVAANKVLLATLILAVLVIAALGVWLLFPLLSLSGPVLDFLTRNGLKGAVEALLGLLRGVWEGTGGR